MKRRRAPQYVKSYQDSTGTWRHYIRKPGLPSTPLPGEPWSDEFMIAYRRALDDDPIQPETKAPLGSIDALIASYYRSPYFRALAPITKSTYRNILERFREEHGAKTVANLRAHHVRRLIDEKADTPSAANHLLDMLRVILNHAVEKGWIEVNPAKGVRRLREKSGGYKTWAEEDVARFLAHHAPGTRERLALALLIYTGQRRADVVRMGRQHIRDGVLTLQQGKTGSTVQIPVLPALQAELDALPLDDLTFLTTSYGKPFTPAGFGNWFRKTCDAAGCKGLSAHGLRKATARRLAEAGCTPSEIQAVLGHAGLAEVALYTAESDRKKLAESAYSRLDDSTGLSNSGK